MYSTPDVLASHERRQNGSATRAWPLFLLHDASAIKSRHNASINGSSCTHIRAQGLYIVFLNAHELNIRHEVLEM